LAIARDLRDSGVPVVGASLNPEDPTCRSNVWHNVLRVPEPTEQAWLATLDEAYSRYGRMVLFPADDMMVRIVAENSADLAKRFDFVMPDLLTVTRLLDKSAFHEWALANDFPVPETVIVENYSELRAAVRDIGFPVMFKPFERTLKWQKLSPLKVFRFDSDAEIDRLTFDPFDAAGRFVVQEFIPGRDSDVYFCLTYRNRHQEELAALVGRKISQWPVDTGNTALAVTHDDADLHKLTRRLLDAADHVGFGSVEVRRSSRDGRMVITEPTVGRPDLQTSLAAAAGVNLVALGYRDAIGLSPSPISQKREAIWAHEIAFLRAATVAVRRPAERKTLFATLRVRRAPVCVYFSARDPRPFVWQMLKMAGKVARTVWKAARGNGRASA
jgi:D-aspartate ligase